MKIPIRILLSVLLILTACNTTDWQQSQTEPQQIQGQLLVWHPFEDINAKVFNDALTEYERVHTGVRIISEYIPQAQLSERFIKQFQAGLGPDLMVNFSTEIPTLVRAETLQVLDETEIAPSSYSSQALTQVRYHGNTYGVPFVAQVRVLCYNRAIVERSNPSAAKKPNSDLSSSDLPSSGPSKQKDTTNAGQPSQTAVPTTLQELLQRAQAGYSVGMVSTFADTFWGIQIFGGELHEFDSTASQDANPTVSKLRGWSQWLDWLRQAANQPNIILGQQRFVLHNAFAQSKLSYYVCDSAEVADFKQTLKEHFGVALLPSEPGHSAGPLLYTRVLALSRNASPTQTRLAYQLTQFLTNPEQQIKSVVQSQDFIPVNQGVSINRHVLPIEAVLLDQSKTAVSIPLDDLDKLGPIMTQGEMLFRQAIIGDLTPIEAEAQLIQAMNQEFASP